MRSLICSTMAFVGIFFLPSTAVADISAEAVQALGICSEQDFSDPASPCYGLAQDLMDEGLVSTDQEIKISIQESNAKVRLSQSRSGAAAKLAENCDSGVYVVAEGYLSDAMQELTDACGWRLIWDPKRGARILDWRVVVPYSVRYSSFGGALEAILQPYGEFIGADIYTDARVVNVEVHEDR